jgi:hypothetical protein
MQYCIVFLSWSIGLNCFPKWIYGS